MVGNYTSFLVQAHHSQIGQATSALTGRILRFHGVEGFHHSLSISELFRGVHIHYLSISELNQNSLKPIKTIVYSVSKSVSVRDSCSPYSFFLKEAIQFVYSVLYDTTHCYIEFF